jgi:hypothetical protein
MAFELKQKNPSAPGEDWAEGKDEKWIQKNARVRKTKYSQ